MDRSHKFRTMTRAELYNVEVPQRTYSYEPVSHKQVIESMLELADRNGMILRSEEHRTNAEGRQVISRLNFVGTDSDIGISMMSRNSYDKSMSLGFAIGGNVWICSNGCVAGDITLVRKHTRYIQHDIQHTLVTAHNKLEREYGAIVKSKERLLNLPRPDKKTTAELVGRMLLEQDVLTTTQLGIVRRELDFAKEFTEGMTAEKAEMLKAGGHFIGGSMWDFYNNITEALKTSHAREYIERHQKFHSFIMHDFVEGRKKGDLSALGELDLSNITSTTEEGL